SLSTLPSLGPPFPLGGLFFAPAFHAGAMSAVPGGVVTTVGGADGWVGKSAFRVINLQISATLGVARDARPHGFVEAAARDVSLCGLSRHGQNCSRHHRENAEQGVAGLAHSPLRSMQSARGVAQGLPDRRATPALRAAHQFLSEGTAR